MTGEITVDQLFMKEQSIIDVRSPEEFRRGHIPGARNIPLFSDSERAIVGTVYKQKSKQAAIDLAYKYVTPKLQWYVDEAIKISNNGSLVVYCWRGGMRSKSFTDHLIDNGLYNVSRVIGGYKAYRNYVLTNFARPYRINVLGGYTGSGKTHILAELSKLGEQVIDLEKLARHKGSAFGGIGQKSQPTTEQFENDLFHQIRIFDSERDIWVEDESHSIGHVVIPLPFFKQIREGKLFFIDISVEERIKLLVDEYSALDKTQLADAINRISKRLGGLNKQLALSALNDNNFSQVARIALQYYDKSYLKGMKDREQSRVSILKLMSVDHVANAKELLKMVKQ